ncbi:MAG TPA: alanine racemase [Elusimicrobiota bacterium]|nr:alanine racemase [Elusimicrobiota bacterium]HMX94668.1 alanine racemase [Elusimicrobiota bacterium]HNC73544.1 alanine racemase [Elusimicrobiota bacterium]HNG45039.1 alanine racemase [Elusimicrobiota bacterium]
MKPLRWVEIDLGAIAANFRAVRRLVGPSAPVTAVVKGDGYGHGAVQVAKTCLEAGARDVAVTYLEEALPLRRAGVRAPLLVMGPLDPAEAGLAAKENLSVMVDNEPLLKALARRGRARPVSVQVKVDLGLRRWGIPLEALADFLKKIEALPGLRLDGVFAHPGYMADKNAGEVDRRLRAFVAAARPLMKPFPKARLHGADSAVLLDFPEFRLDGVRVGNLLYGMNPTRKDLSLKNPWFPRTRVVRVIRANPGDTIGYGSQYIAEKTLTLGTLPVGYAHGFTLELAPARGNPYWVTIEGVRCPVIGRVGMSHTVVDLSGLPRPPREGDIAALPLRRTASALWEKVYI